MSDILQAFKDWAYYDSEKKAAKARIEECQANLDRLDPILRDHFEQQGLSSLGLDGVGRFSIKREIWAKIEDKDAAAQVLKITGYGALVHETFNSNSLSAILREYDADQKPLPDEWVKVGIAPNEVFKIKLTKGK